MANLTNFSFEFFYEIFTEDASQLLLYHGAKKSKMTKNSNQGGSCLNTNKTLLEGEFTNKTLLNLRKTSESLNWFNLKSLTS